MKKSLKLMIGAFSIVTLGICSLPIVVACSNSASSTVQTKPIPNLSKNLFISVLVNDNNLNIDNSITKDDLGNFLIKYDCNSSYDMTITLADMFSESVFHNIGFNQKAHVKYEVINNNDFEINNNILKSKTFKKNEPLSTLELNITISQEGYLTQSKNIFINFENTNKDIGQDEELSDKGGNYNGLIVSSYLDVIKKIEFLKKEINFSIITNEKLNNEIHAYDKLKNLTLSIDEKSNQRLQKLVLNLSGSYNNKAINAQIEITNFINIKNKTFRVEPIIDTNVWFDKMVPLDINALKKLNKDDLIKIFANSKIIFNLSNNNLYETTLSELITNFDILEINVNDFNKLFIKLRTKYFSYNQGWVIDVNNQDILSSDDIKNPEIKIPSLQDLLNYINNQIQIKDEIKQYYPSYFYGINLSNSNDFINLSPIINNLSNVNEIINKYKETYFKNHQLFFSIGNDMIADDINGNITFTIIVWSDMDNEIKSYRTINISDMKKIQKTGLSKWKWKDDDRVTKILKKKLSAEIEKCKNDGQKIEVELINNNSQFILFNKENNINNINSLDKAELFASQPINEIKNLGINDLKLWTINIDNGLYCISNDDMEKNAFFINSISLQRLDTINIIIQKENDFVTGTINCKMIIDSCNSNSIENDVEIKFTLG